MADRNPVKATIVSGAATGLAEFAVGDTVGLSAGGTGATTAAAARTNLDVPSNATFTLASVPVGFVGHYPGSSLPAGWLKRNGAAVSRTTYAALFAVIGTTFGAGDGSTTFNVPEDRASVDRGWDDSRGIDSGRALGSEQLDALQGFKLEAVSAVSGSGPGSPYNALVVGPSTGTETLSSRSFLTNTFVTDGVNGTPRTAAETRMRNRAYLPIIKY